jgi:nickel-type superoxide dismutase maturation protease
MVPALRDGDFVLARRVRADRVRPGDVVVARHPRRADGLLVVKRAVRRTGGGWWLEGDNAFVTSDSREFGAVPDGLILARAVLRLRDPLRVARIPGKR